MEKLMYLEINMITIIILSIILINVREKVVSKLNMDQFLFRGLVIAILITSFLDTLILLLSGVKEPYIREINLIVSMLYYILNPLCCLFWLLYAEYKMHRKRKALLRKIPLYSIPFVINMIISIISVFTGCFFTINANNMYERGPLFLLFSIISTIYLVMSLVIAIKEIGKREWGLFKSEFKFYVIFPIIVILLVIIQAILNGISLIWIGASLFLLSIFMTIQKSEIFTDYLTGLYNRKILDSLLELKISKHKNDSRLFLALIDVDDFKNINDTYGHNIGDKALIKIADILQSVCDDSDDLVVRLGGDEFLIAGERSSLYQIEYIKNDLLHKIVKFNETNKDQYTLSISIGFAILDDEIRNAHKLINAADQRMYANKQIKKQSR